MKICFIADATSVHTQRWAQHFVQKNNEVIVLSRKSGYIAGAEVITLPPIDHEKRFVRGFQALRTALVLRFTIASLQPDIVHLHYLYGGPASVLSCWGVNNLVVSPWGSDIIKDYSTKPQGSSFWRRFVFRQARIVTATSEFLANVIRQYTDKEVHIVPFGVDCKLFCPPRRRTMSPVVTLGFVKLLRPVYGPEYLIRAMSLVIKRYPQTRLLMVGTGQLRDQLEDLTKQLGLTEQVAFLGAIEHQRIPEVLREVDIFVMPSLGEAFGVAALEAQAMEIPVVATRVGGIPEVVKDGVTGILVEPRNPEQVATAIIELIEDPVKRRRMGKEGRKHVLANYRWEDNATLMETLYQQVLQSSSET